MHLKLNKIDAIIVAALIVIAGVFLYKAGYFENVEPIDDMDDIPETPGNDTAPPDEELPSPPASFIPSYRRDVSPEDEGVHFDQLRISREWWYFGAIFDDEESELKDWSVMVSFNHMARGDLIGTAKPDLLVVSLFGDNQEMFGGMINKKRYLGILNQGTLIANSPGVKVEFEDSWAEGVYPDWHVHAEDNDIDNEHVIVIDLDYHSSSLPLWTIGTRAFDKSESSIANYLFSGLEVSGRVVIDGKSYQVKGTGHHEHSWTPHAVTKGSINGWDWFYMTLENGWNVYISNFYPTPQVITSKSTKLNPYGSVIITTDNGETITELKNLDLNIVRSDNQIFPLVKMPVDFEILAKPSLNPIHAISQSFLYGTNTELSVDIEVRNSYNKVWKFPTDLKSGRA